MPSNLQYRIQSLSIPRLGFTDGAEIMRYFENSWALNEWLFESITDEETFLLSPDPLRNPLIFYLGHTAAFYVNKLELAGLLQGGVDKRLDYLFAVGVDPADAAELGRQPVWPSVQAVRNYRQTVHDLVRNLLEDLEWPEMVSDTDPHWAVLMAMEHDRIHFETSSVLIRQLPENLVRRPSGWEYAPMNVGEAHVDWVEVGGGKVCLGKSKEAETFGWDNEYGKLEVQVAPFLVTAAQVTNAEYLQFVEAGGYADSRWWSPQGWEWIRQHGAQTPRFWVRDGKDFRYRAMFDVFPMPMDWPVEVNCFEAMAYCKWSGDGHRLLTEGEWRLLAVDAAQRVSPDAADGSYDLHLAYGSPRPASLAPTQGSLGIKDIIGNVWDWVSDDFRPLPGFQVHRYYPDFSQPYFGEAHGMMLGGSWATTGASATMDYRLWFRRSFIQHAGFRLAKSVEQ